VAVVTGANKGIGYDIARILATEGLVTVVTARNPELGNAAVAKLQTALPNANIDFIQLDITDPASVAACAESLKSKYGKIDILVNNAGISFKGNIFGADEAATTINCNLKGTRSITEAVLPLMGSEGRIVNICSRCEIEH
jgi:carbonyl reductase 1